MFSVLVVDDEHDVKPLFLQKFRRELKKRQLYLDFAFSAEEALRKMTSTENPDYVLILSDINMPGISGLELLKQIKLLYPKMRVVMITAYGDAESYQLAMTYGADGFLTKPVDFKELKKMICNT